MTKRIEKQTIIKATPYQVYNFISQPENWPQITNISSVSQLSDQPSFSLTTKTLLGTKSTKITLIKSDPPKHFSYKNDSSVFTNESGFDLAEHPEGTLVTAYTQVESGPLANALSLHGLTKNAEKDLEATLNNLQITLGKINPPKDTTPDPEIVSDLEEINTLLKKSPDTQSE